MEAMMVPMLAPELLWAEPVVLFIAAPKLEGAADVDVAEMVEDMVVKLLRTRRSAKVCGANNINLKREQL